MEGVSPQQRAQAPPAVNAYSFAHGTDFQSACEILREGQVRPSPVLPGSKADPCVVYGSGTTGPLTEWSLQVCSAQLLKKPRGRQDIVLIGSCPLRIAV